MPQPYSGILDFYQRGPYAAYLKEHRLAGSTPVRMFKVAQPAGHYPDPPTPDLAIQLCLSSPVAERIDWGAGVFRGRMDRGTLGLAPADTPGDYCLATKNEFLVTAIPMTQVQTALQEACPSFKDFGRLHAAPFRDSVVEALCPRLWDEAAAGSPSGTLFADIAVQTIALALLRRCEQLPEPQPVRGGLAPWRLKRVLDLLEDQLAEDLSLDDLAAAAGLSPVYLVRAFKQATGSTPHRYLVERRVERAKELLEATDLPIAEVALACGFASQSHLATWFGRLVRVSPGAYRRERPS